MVAHHRSLGSGLVGNCQRQTDGSYSGRLHLPRNQGLTGGQHHLVPLPFADLYRAGGHQLEHDSALLRHLWHSGCASAPCGFASRRMIRWTSGIAERNDSTQQSLGEVGKSNTDMAYLPWCSVLRCTWCKRYKSYRLARFTCGARVRSVSRRTPIVAFNSPRRSQESTTRTSSDLELGWISFGTTNTGSSDVKTTFR